MWKERDVNCTREVVRHQVFCPVHVLGRWCHWSWWDGLVSWPPQAVRGVRYQCSSGALWISL